MHNAPNQLENDWMPPPHSLEVRKRIMFYCQSSLGIGHTMRSLRLAKGISEDFHVCFINGAEVISQLQYPDNIEVISLPPVITDAEFTKLKGTGNNPQSVDELFEQRRNIMLHEYKQFMPEILIIELYPFGRNSFSKELLPLLQFARSNGTKTICSLRDIVVHKRDRLAYEEKVVSRMNEYFDVLLIHGDPDFISLDDTFTRLAEIQAKVFYTGYVAPTTGLIPKEDFGGVNKPETIVASIGGGRFGHELAEAVVKVAPLLKDIIPHKITLFTGPFCPEHIYENLKQIAHGQTNITVERFTENLHHSLSNADLSISLGGYNTTMDVLSTGVRALMMSCFNKGGMDQSIRLQKLADKGAIELLSDNELEPQLFAERIITSLKKNTTNLPFNLNGVSTTRQIITNLFDAV